MKISDILRQKLSEMPFETPGLGETAWMANISQDGGAFLEPVSLKVLGRTKDGISRPRIVRLLDGRKGFWKDSSPFDESDDAEIVIQYLGRRMGIEMAQEYRIFDKELIKDGLLSLDAARKPGEHFIEMRTLQSKAGREVLEGRFPWEPWMAQWTELIRHPAFPESGGSEYLCRSDDDCRVALELPLHVARILYGGETRDFSVFRRQYFKMILFDLFIGQTDRTTVNYGILEDAQGSFRLAPLFDNANLRKPYLPENLFTLNYAAIDRERLLELILRGYAEDAAGIAAAQVREYEENRELFEKLADTWIDNENRSLLCRNMERDIARKKRLLRQKGRVCV